MAETFQAPQMLTPEISTGNIATVNDPVDATKVTLGARNPLGAAVWSSDSSGRLRKYRYVKLSGTGTPSTSNCPGVVYWKDNTYQVVTPTMSEAVFNALNSVAGILLNTAATNLNYVFIQVAGYLASCQVPASTAISDALVGGGAAFVLVRVASGTAPTGRVVAISNAAVASNKADVFIVIESL